MLIALGYTIYLISRCRIAFAGEPIKAVAFVCAFAGMFAGLLVINMRKETAAQKKIYQYNEENLPWHRHYNFYIGEYICREECGKTIRMFHQQKLLVKCIRELFCRIHKNIDRISREEQSRNEWGGVIEVLISGFIYLLVGIMAMKKSITIGSVCLFAGCIENFLYHFRMWGQQLDGAGAKYEVCKKNILIFWIFPIRNMRERFLLKRGRMISLR